MTSLRKKNFFYSGSHSEIKFPNKQARTNRNEKFFTLAQPQYEDICLYDIYSQRGLVKEELFDEIKDLLKSNIFEYLFYDKVCFISRPPVFVNRDEEGRLHSSEDYAIYFKDGYGEHYLYGIYFPEQEFLRDIKVKNVSGKDILEIKNLEKKSALIKLHGYEKIINNLPNLKVLDTFVKKSSITGKDTTCQVLEFVLDDSPFINGTIRVVKLEDHSIHKITFIGVPRLNQTKTCKGAIAWSFGLKPGDYDPVIES